VSRNGSRAPAARRPRFRYAARCEGAVSALVASGGAIGVVGILPNTATEGFEPERFHYLEAFANQAAIAIERSFLGQAAQRALLKAETESLRNTLSSISTTSERRCPR